ncbi:hypothetical protein ACSQ67_020970 [Phaseolus vulgaris]
MGAAEVMPETPLQAVPILSRESSFSSSPRRLEGKVAIVTGGARGIGEATVRVFVKNGARVVIADVEDALGTMLAETLAPSATYVHCDVSVEEEVENLVSSTVSRYGQVDIMFNNAGVLGNQSKNKSILNFDPNEFDRVMQVNVKGMALGIKHAARAMIPKGIGCIISTASVAGVMGGLAHMLTLPQSMPLWG